MSTTLHSMRDVESDELVPGVTLHDIQHEQGQIPQASTQPPVAQDVGDQRDHGSTSPSQQHDTLLDTQPHVPSEVPETVQLTDQEFLHARRYGSKPHVPGISADSTQPISQSFYTTLIRKSKSHSLPEDVDDAVETQKTLEEGDQGHVDIMSSFVTGQPQQEDFDGSQMVDFSPTQSQHNLTQYPESERFKTPATAGRKRNYRGEVVDSPLQPRNPLRDGAPTPGNVVGLSQVFAGTQAPSSPFSNGLTTGHRSDRPSPNIELQARPASAMDSSPLREISEFKRAVTEPASRYVSVKQSQAERDRDEQLKSDEEDVDDDEEDDIFNEEPSYVERSRRRKEREERLHQKLHLHSVPSMSPHDRREGGTTPGHAGLDAGEAHSAEAIAVTEINPNADQSELESEVETELGEDLVEGTQQAVMDDEDKENQMVDVPRTVTSNRLHNFVNGSLSEIDASPLTRQFMHPSQAIVMNSSAFQDVPNSQPGEDRKKVLQDSHKVARSSAASTRTEPQNEGDLVTAEEVTRSSGNKSMEHPTTSEPSVEAAAQSSDIIVEDIRPPSNSVNGPSMASTIPETDSDLRDGGTEPKSASVENRNETDSADHFGTAATHAAAPEEMSSQPVSKTPPGKRRRRLMDISAEPSPLKSTPSFNFQEALELDKDAEVGQILSRTPRTTRAIGNLRMFSTSDRQGSSESPLVEEDLAQAPPVRQQRVEPSNSAPLPVNKDTHKRPSIWDLDDSPKKPLPKANERKKMPRMSKHVSRIEERLNPSTMPAFPTAATESLEAGHSATIAGNHVEDEHNDEDIIAPNRVFACFNGKIRAYYPAICLSRLDGDTRKYRIQWEGYDPDEVDAHGVSGLDLRRGDAIKVNLQGFPKVPYIVHGFKDKAARGTSELTDVRGYRTLVVRPKQRKRVPSSTGSESLLEVPIGAIYLDNNMWGQMKNRPFDFKADDSADIARGAVTPLDRAGTPNTPSSRRRLQALSISSNVHPKTDGLFSGMAFAVSYNDLDRKNSLVALIQEQNGLILSNSFDELFNADQVELQEHFADLGFTVLLTEAYSRKEKYMQALALGLPCLSGTWVEACVKNKRLLNWQTYLLPAGECTELDGAARSRILPSVITTDGGLDDLLKVRPLLLDGSSTIVVTGKGKSEMRWAKYVFLIRAMGASNIVKVSDVHAAQTLLEGAGSYDWLFVDDKDVRTARDLLHEKPTSSRRAKAKSTLGQQQQSRCRIAGPELIVQSLILGQLSSSESM